MSKRNARSPSPSPHCHAEYGLIPTAQRTAFTRLIPIRGSSTNLTARCFMDPLLAGSSSIEGPVLPHLHLDLRFGFDGSASLVPQQHEQHERRSLPPYVQGPVAAPLTAGGAIQQLRHAYFFWDACEALQDVSLCGHVLGCRFHGTLPPATTPDCSLPTSFVQTVMPDPLQGVRAAPGSSPASSGTEVAWKQVAMSLQDQAQDDDAGLRARLAARQESSSSSWRGFAVSVPYTPGTASDPLGPGTTPLAAPLSSPAVLEAESGLWLQELRLLHTGQAHGVPRVRAPGLPYGLFGSWEWEADGSAATSHATPAAPPAASQGGPAAASRPSAAAPEAAGLFDDLWMLAEEAEEAPDALDAQAVAPEPAPSVLSRVADTAALQHGAVGSGEGGGASAAIDSLLEASAAQITQDGARAAQAAHDRKPAAAPRAATLSAMPLAGQSSSSASGQYEWAVRGNLPDLDARWARLKPNLALHYPFELDIFQKEAICHMEASKSVFVAAHTSAGKTVVAEYAFALATRHCTRAVYTSPIKTISNQKFRDFSGKFEVGLLTGDVQIKTASPCLIMTTEILRSMLYKGADVIRDIEWVVFDEVHYVNDAERGVVWEEVIIMLPPHVNIVMLSATVPNVMDFADWVGRTKRKIVHVTGTTKRPVPLEHALYYGGEMYTISTREVWVPEGIRQATLAWKKKNEVPETKRDEKAARPTGRGGGPVTTANSQGGRGGGGRGGGGFGPRPGGGADFARKQLQGGGNRGGSNGNGNERGQMLQLISSLGKKQLLPVAFFCFSKKRCDSSADSAGGVDLTTSAEKHTIHVFVEKCLVRLREEDRQLPQIKRLRDLMRRGLAVHHAGLLPIMKEVVEMLFCQGYIKVLFCTETFAMGVNAPTRTVVFHSLRKHDGKSFRFLLPSEYTQMAGRAGRRGLDPVGTVLVACWEDVPPEAELRTMLTGRGVSLESRFRLTYSMILNLLRVEDLKVEDMLKRSFAEWRAQRSQPQALIQLDELEKQLLRLSSRPWPSCIMGCTQPDIQAYHEVSSRIEQLNAALQERLMQVKSVQQALVPGRPVLYLNPVNGLTELALVLGDPEESRGGAASGAARPGVVSGESGAAPDRRLYLLVLHRPGPVDERHVKMAEEQREKAEAAAAGSSARHAQQALQDQFQGMVLRQVGGKGGGGAGGRGKALDPGPLPRYGELAGLSYLVVEAGSREVVGICRAKLKVDGEALLSGEWEDAPCRQALVAALRGLVRLQEEAGGGEPALLDWRADLKVADLDTSAALAERGALMARRAALRPHACPSLSEQYGLVRARDGLSRRRDALRHQLSDANLQQMPEFHQRVAVLQQLGYLDADRTVTLKGRVACEINSTQDELVASEMLFAGLLSDLSPEEAVALISALVFQEKSDVEPELPPALADARKNLETLVTAAAVAQREQGMQIEPAEYVREAMHCGLMQVVYEWARGTPFDQICELTDVMEGSIVRAIVRLDQACRELMDAARVMGNTSLFQKMQSASAAIKRDVIFAASLYVA